jgi:hypothetical protein
MINLKGKCKLKVFVKVYDDRFRDWLIWNSLPLKESVTDSENCLSFFHLFHDFSVLVLSVELARVCTPIGVNVSKTPELCQMTKTTFAQSAIRPHDFLGKGS